MASFRRDLANLTVNLDMNSTQLIQKSQESARYINSLKNASGGTERGFGQLQNKMNGVASAMASLGVPQPLMTLNAFSTVANSLVPVFQPIIKGVTDFAKNLKSIDMKPMTTSLSDGFSSMLNNVKRISSEIINTILRMITRITGMNIPLIGGTGNVGGGALQGLTHAATAGGVAGITSKFKLPNISNLFTSKIQVEAIKTASVISALSNLLNDKLSVIWTGKIGGSVVDVDYEKKLKKQFENIGGYFSKLKLSKKLLIEFMGGANLKNIDILRHLNNINLLPLIGKFNLLISTVGNALSKIGKFIFSFSTLGAAVSIVGLVSIAIMGLTKLIVNATKDLDKLAKTAKSMQMSNIELKFMQDFGDYQGWAEGAEKIIIRMMDKSLIAARGGSKGKIDAFAMLGVDFDKSVNKWDRFQEILKGLSKLSKDDQQFAAMEIFGSRNAAQVIQGLDGYADTLDRVKKNRDISPYINLKDIEEAQDRASDLSHRWSSLKDSFKVAFTLPIVNTGVWVSEQFVKLLNGAKTFGSEMAAMFSGETYFSSELIKMIPALDKLFKSSGEIIDEESITESFTTLEKALEKIKSPAEGLKEELIDLKRLVDQNYMSQDQYNKYIDYTVDAMLSLDDPVRKYRTELEKINELQNMGVITSTQYADALNKITDTLTSPADKLIDSVKSPLDKLQDDLKEMGKISQGYMVDGVKIGGLTDEQMISYKKSKVGDYIKSLHNDLDGLLKFAAENKDTLSDTVWSNALQDLINKAYNANTPLTEFQNKLINLNDGFNSGYLGIEQYRKSVDDLVTGFQPATDKFDEISAKLVNMSNLGKQLGTEKLLDLTSGLLPIERISAVMDAMMLGGLNQRTALTAINTLFGQLQDEVFNLEDALSLGNISPILFEEKLAPLLDGLREAQWIASNIFGSSLDMGSVWFNKQREMMQAQAEQIKQYEEDMAEAIKDMWFPAERGPGLFGSVQFGELGDAGTAGLATSTQIAGVMATARYAGRKPEIETADNTRDISNKMEKLIYVTERGGGLL